MTSYNALTYRQRIAIIVGITLTGFAALLLLEPIPQDPAYHLFADSRSSFGIPNFYDVISNSAFLLAGTLGLTTVLGENRSRTFLTPADARPYLLFFISGILIGLGSAYYHWQPSNERLFWDRLAMSTAFMSLSAAVLADRIHAKSGRSWILVVLVMLGILSLAYWIHTEQFSQGDLRFYGFVQFFPLALLPFIIWFFPDYHYLPGRTISWIVGWYTIAKALEHFDGEIYILSGELVGGHTLKHLAAAMSSLVVFRTLITLRTSDKKSNGNGEI